MWIPNLRSASEFTFGVAISMLAVTPTQAADNYASGECHVLSRPYNDSAQIYPTSSAASYLVMLLGGDPQKNLDRVGGSFEGGEITIVKAPKHGEEDMFFIDLPNADVQPIIVAQSASIETSKANSSGYYATSGVCQVMLENKGVTTKEVSTIYASKMLFDYLISARSHVIQALILNDPDLAEGYSSGVVPQYLLKNTRINYYDLDPATIVITVLEAPKNGKLVDGVDYYIPNQGFIGRDQFVLQGEVKNRKVKLIYYVNVLNSNAFDKIRDDLVAQSKVRSSYCPNDTQWMFPLDGKK
jgi:hypothetical protein